MSVATARSVVRLGSAAFVDQTHFWFPQASLTFVDGNTIAVNIQLGDDSGSCNPPACEGCSKVKPCGNAAEQRRVLLSRDGGMEFSVVTGGNGTTSALASFSISYGAVTLNPLEVLTTATMAKINPLPVGRQLRPLAAVPRSAHKGVRPNPTTATTSTSSQSFGAVGHKLFLSATTGSFANATSSHHIVVDGIPAELNVTRLLRWCDVATIAEGLYGEIVQLELGGGAPEPKRAAGAKTREAAPSRRELVFTASNDNFTFSYTGTIARSTDPVFAVTSNGPCESAVTALPLSASVVGLLRRAGFRVSSPTGTRLPQLLLAVFRVDSFAPYYHSVSIDSGRVWSPPQPCPAGVGSVRPRLRTIIAGGSGGDATVMLVGGRPGLMLWFGSVASVVTVAASGATLAGFRSADPELSHKPAQPQPLPPPARSVELPFLARGPRSSGSGRRG